jgi:hypothetical protein
MVVVASTGAHAQATLRVIDTAPNDVLNVREYPTSDSRIVGVIPPDGRGITSTGDRNGNWVFVRYKKVEGCALNRRALVAILSPCAQPSPPSISGPAATPQSIRSSSGPGIGASSIHNPANVTVAV